MFRSGESKVFSLTLCAVLILGTGQVLSVGQTKADTLTNIPGTQVVSGSVVTTDPANITLNKTTGILMAGKKVTLAISGTMDPVTWTSLNPDFASVSETGVVSGIKSGVATIQAEVSGVVRQFNVTIVPAMSQKDFGKFNSENFVSYCKRKGYSKGYAWVGQWRGAMKKKATYRKIKIGSSKQGIQNAYGELSWKKCTSKDPFTKMKGLKKSKVKTYGDVTYGTYRIRFYLDKSDKVVAIILACNIGRIKKNVLKQYM